MFTSAELRHNRVEGVNCGQNTIQCVSKTFYLCFKYKVIFKQPIVHFTGLDYIFEVSPNFREYGHNYRAECQHTCRSDIINSRWQLHHHYWIFAVNSGTICPVVNQYPGTDRSRNW